MQIIVSSAPYITSQLITLILHLHNYKFATPMQRREIDGEFHNNQGREVRGTGTVLLSRDPGWYNFYRVPRKERQQ